MKHSGSSNSRAYPADPVVIGSDDHPIGPELIDADARKVLRRLWDAGYKAYLVGGGVRDLYLGRTPKDFDISTEARPGQIRKLFRNSQTIGRRFRLVQIFFHGGKVVEVSTLRSLSEHDLDGPEAVLAPNNTFGTLDEDAQRRDLTINSLFYSLNDNSIIDYVGGITDLDRSVIRIVGDPERRINRDPVRMLRAVRHGARLGFTIEEKSLTAIRSHHRALSLCPPSRLRDELFKDLQSGSLSEWFRLMHEADLFCDLVPLYQGVLYKKGAGSETGREQLERIFPVVDRIVAKLKADTHAVPLPNYFLLALLLLPWADISFSLVEKRRKGREAFQLTKAIRVSLDEGLGQQLNLRRSLRQEITTLLANLPLFLLHDKDGNLPKWLKKKSYFEMCQLFYRCYLEAWQKGTVDDELLHLSSPAAADSRRGRPSRKRSSRSRTRPSFAHGAKSGIFGFKK
ncbi:MAG: polya polymerase [Thermodesulfobacteriota bacterium]